MQLIIAYIFERDPVGRLAEVLGGLGVGVLTQIKAENPTGVSLSPTVVYPTWSKAMMYGWWDGYSGPWYGMIFGPIMMIAFIVLTVLVVAWLLRALGLGWQPPRSEKSALDILKDRFARGEINQSEYEERRHLLSSS
jgi:putative membrane protein